jgi:GT2 family glycosyltransferase
LIQSDYPADHLEVLVLDGGSDDGTRSVVLELARKSDLIRLLDNPRRVAAAAVNIGVQNASGDVIIILSAHGSVASDFVTQNVLYLSKTGADCVFRYSRTEQYVDTVAFGAYRRQVFEELGPFDESLAYNEDDEFSCRLRGQGGKIFLTPAIKSFYHTRTSLRQLWQQYFRYGQGKVRVIQRHPRAAMIRHFVPFAFVSTVLVVGLLGLVRPSFLSVCLVVLAVYGGASLLFSLGISARRGWRHLPVLPAAFACLHFGYGLGFLAGLLGLVRASVHSLLIGEALD